MESKLRPKPWLPASEPPNTLFLNANVIDPELGKVHSGASVKFSNGIIVDTSFDPSAPLSADTATTQIIDLDGKYLCPGLIDCHVHLSAVPGSYFMKELYGAHPNTIAYRTTYVVKEMLLRGFTTARDCGGADACLRDAIAEGIFPGPRLFVAGKALSQTGGHGDFRTPYQGVEHKCCGGHAAGLSRVCDGVPECLQAARDELRQGADFLKLMCGGGLATLSDPIHMIQFTDEEIQAITKTASYLKTYVTAHAYTPEAIRHAVDNGVKAIEHANLIDRDTAKYLASKNIFVTPTLVAYRGVLRPPFENWLNEAQQAKAREILNVGLRSIQLCVEEGVTLCYGSDLLAGMNVWQNEEFTLRAEAQPSLDVLRSATINAAKLLRQEGKLGVIKKGAIADVLVLSENPLEDIRVLDRMPSTLLCIMKDGRVVASKLDDLVPDASYSSLQLPTL